MPGLFIRKLLAFISLWTTASFAALPLQVEDFFHGSKLTSPRISADGTKVLYVQTRRQRENLMVYDLAKSKATRLTILGSENASINSLAWVGSEQVLYQIDGKTIWLHSLGGSMKKLYEPAMRSVNLPGALFLFREGVTVEHIPSGEADHVVIGLRDGEGRHVMRRLSLTGEVLEEIQTPRNLDRISVDFTGEVRFGVRYLRDRVEFHVRDPGNGRWRTLDRYVDTEEARFTYSADSQLNRRFVFMSFDPLDPDRIIYVSNVGRDTYGLFSLSLRETAEPPQLLFEDPTYDLVNDIPRTGIAFFGTNPKRLVGMRYFAEKARTQWLDPHFVAIQGQVDAELPGKNNFITDWDVAEKRFVVVSSASDQLPMIYVWDSEAAQLSPIGDSGSRLTPEDLSPMQAIQFPGRDGRTLHGYLTIPKGQPADAPNALIVLLHGGPWARDVYGYNPEVQYLAHLGYSVLQINFRGSTGYGFAHMDASRQNYGQAALDDIIDGTRWAIAQGYTTPDRLAVMGASYGGYASLLAMVREPELFRCGVLMSGIYDLTTAFEHVRENSDLAYAVWRRMVGSLGDKKALRSISPLFEVEKLQGPVLVIHGQEDDIALPSESTRLVEALEKSGKPHRFYAIPEEGHGFYQIKHTVFAYERVREFLETHLPPDPQP